MTHSYKEHIRCLARQLILEREGKGVTYRCGAADAVASFSEELQRLGPSNFQEMFSEVLDRYQVKRTIFFP